MLEVPFYLQIPFCKGVVDHNNNNVIIMTIMIIHNHNNNDNNNGDNSSNSNSFPAIVIIRGEALIYNIYWQFILFLFPPRFLAQLFMLRRCRCSIFFLPQSFKTTAIILSRSLWFYYKSKSTFTRLSVLRGKKSPNFQINFLILFSFSKFFSRSFEHNRERGSF